MFKVSFMLLQNRLGTPIEKKGNLFFFSFFFNKSFLFRLSELPNSGGNQLEPKGIFFAGSSEDRLLLLFLVVGPNFLPERPS